jgi:hypothetical protein
MKIGKATTRLNSKLQKTSAWDERLVEKTRDERPTEYFHFKVAAKVREKEQWAKRWEATRLEVPRVPRRWKKLMGGRY